MMRVDKGRTKDEKAWEHASIVIVLLALLLSLSSCGYGFTPPGGVIPENARVITIPPFLNQTREPYVDVEVTKATVDEFLSDGRLKTAGPEAADLVLKGTVVRYDAIPLSYTADSYVQQYQIGIVVDVKLEDAKSHAVIWKESGLGTVFVASYAVTIGDIIVTKIAKDAALIQASRDVARTIRSRILDGF